MKKLLKLLGFAVGLLVVVVGGAAAYFSMGWPPTFPDTPKPAIAASDDPQVIARGDYLFHAVMHCPVCHAPHDTVNTTKVGDKIAPVGGGEWVMGPLGTLRSPNLTAATVQGYSDEELARVIKHAVKRNDEPAIMMMAVGAVSDEDLTAVVSYIRTLESQGEEVAPSEVGLMGKFLFQGPMAFFARPKDYPVPPFVKEGGVSVERGKYLFEGPAFCMGCHSQIEWDGEAIKFIDVGAGRTDPDFPDPEDPSNVHVAVNLTPDPDTSGIAGWDEQKFVERMRAGRQYKNSPMPWEAYALMTDEDLKSLWAYMEALPPTKNVIGPSYRPKDWQPPG